MDSNQAALRPLTLPSALSPELAKLSQLKLALAQAEAQIEGYKPLEGKLATLTDEPTWNAFIPFGPLAYFPGQLVHTNDITRVDHGDGTSQPQRVLRSAKQATADVVQRQRDLEDQVRSLTQEIQEAEASLRRKREEDRTGAKGAHAATADLGDEDWTINAHGEVINEEGLPMFDIREDLPPDDAPAASTSAEPTSASPSAPARRYLIKKGGKQVVRPLSPPAAQPPVRTAPTPAPATPAASLPPADLATEIDPNPFPARPVLDVKAILDELEAEEAADAAAAAAAAPPSAEPERAAEAEPSPTVIENPAQPPAEPASPASAVTKPASSSAGGFGGFSAGFLAKSKQKRPSNSLAPVSSAAGSTFSAPVACATPAPGLKPALSRPGSPARPGALEKSEKEKKRVAFDLPPPSAAEEQQAPAAKKAPILLGPPPAATAGDASEKSKAIKQPVQRPVRDVVVERPLRKPVPPGPGPAGAPGGLPVREKRLSRFKRENFGGAGPEGKEGGVDARSSQPQPEREPEPEPAPPVIAEERSPASTSAETPAQPAIPAPVHTISLSARPSGPGRADGTVSFGDIPFDSDEDEDLAPNDGEEDDEEDVDWSYSDEEDDIDDEELDVDLALHQREVALAYHRQRMALGAGRGTGPLGGFHNEGENPFGAAAADVDQSLVPADATLQSLDPALNSAMFGAYPSAGSAQEGRPSRFRQANRNFESAQLIIPSLLAADPALSMSHTPLGPPLASDADAGEAGAELGGEEEERLRRTLEALAEGRPLPEDEQAEERAKEVALREELAREKGQASRDRTAGKRPPDVLHTVVPERKAPAAVVEKPVVAASPAATDGPAEEKPKRMSRFRQKQLGLIE